MKKYKDIIKKIIIIIIGIVSALFLSEFFLHKSGFNPKVSAVKSHWVNADEFIKWAYIDICEPFFKIENNKFYIQRTDLWSPQKIQKYTVQKIKNKKRIIITGESTARNFEAKILEKTLSKYFDVEIINAAMGGYDSYRIEKITKEIKKFNPDWVFVMMGNNDGINDLFNMPKIDPVDINSLPYRYKFLNNIYTLNILSGFFHPGIVLNKNNVEKNFQNNVLKIIGNLKNTNVIFCDLPNNEQYQSGNIVESLKQRTSRQIYVKSLWKNTADYSALLSRMAFLRTLPDKYKNIYIANLTETIRLYTDGQLDYKIFYDNYHFREETYMLVSDIIAKIILKQDYGENIELSLKQQEYADLLTKNRFDIPNHDMSDESGYNEAFWFQFHEIFGYDQYCSYFGKLINQHKQSGLDETFAGYEKIYDNYKKNQNRTRDMYMYMVLYADLLQHLKEEKKSEAILKTLINSEPNYFEAYLIKGYGYYKKQDYKKAEEYFNIVNQLNKDSKISVSFLNSLK